ncbi:Hypothetical protein CpMEX30_0925 [Corynebacterium pseudotuberculosis]|nr:Hypothetical protein Cp106_0860 [Corynebacterium pseudotuberculosis 1/06-A]AKS13220.1 Hypothetical protein CpE19_0881 [Corynebacterium pseudotuberculosis]APQ53978.1 Hypothetical protein CpMEX30_0925 [Corynebacterium pseudotuberculosis]APQ56069.1 Hypothetical protein CpMEX31_0929 [Corynebacterium pseudotuberculosis]ATB61823.1 Hypothetical protein BFF96_0938 [Corynebacterium pseudotuberculosis]
MPKSRGSRTSLLTKPVFGLGYSSPSITALPRCLSPVVSQGNCSCILTAARQFWFSTRFPMWTALPLTQSLIIVFSIGSKQLRNRIARGNTSEQKLIDVSLPIKYSLT